jgi:Ras-related protein Rab-23
VIAFSSTDRESFDAVLNWKRKVEAECGPIAMCLVQNKVDLIEQAKMTPQEAEGMVSKAPSPIVLQP